MDQLQTQILWSLVVPYVIQWLKDKKWFPLVSFDSAGLNRAVSAGVAALASWGIVAHFDYGTGVFTVTGLTADHIWQFVQNSVLQFMMQHAAYKGLIAPPKPGPVQAEERAAAPPKP